MDNRVNKRPYEHGAPSTSHETPKRHKQLCPSPSKMGDVTRNIRLAKAIMTKVKVKQRYELENSSNEKLTHYIRESISKLDQDIKKKTTVGVFGKTGAGKSSLINAVLGEKNLLPSGTICACTSVIIQVEANVTDSNYIAEIEFISKQDWENELETLLKVLSEEDEEKDHVMFSTANDKLTAMYGEEGVFLSKEKLMEEQWFSEISEFLTGQTKKLTCKNATEIADKIICYIQHDDSSPGGLYWPVVSSVTIKIPNCKDFLEHVVLIDLPGTGDCNKSRDQMWRSEGWEIVTNSIRDMAQGGECSSISFICTKTDDINPQNYMRSAKLIDQDFNITSEDPQYTNKRKTACVKHRNNKAKEKVKKIFNQQNKIKEHFNCDDTFLSVFTVSSEEFTKENPVLTSEDTEIPKLKDVLRMYNNTQTTEKSNLYIYGALGILSLIEGFKNTDTDIRERLSLNEKLKTNLADADERMHSFYMNVYHSLQEALSNGAAESEENCVENAKTVIAPKGKDGRGFHRTLTALCKNEGFYRSKAGKSDLNSCLVKNMYNHIDKQFSKFFSGLQGNVSDKTETSLQANIDGYTIIPEELLHNYSNSPMLSHMLKFLQIEEENLKVRITPHILQRKKKIYASLAESIKTSMLPSYQRAAEVSGIGSMKRKQTILLEHIETTRSIMFKEAKEHMLKTFEDEMNETFMEIKNKLMEDMEYSLHNVGALPHMDVSEEMQELEKLITHACD